ncbi:MAG: phosphatase PAP2 family protein [Planctomycetes bacterium]|nr:phosphatase PAP2 family protein [Planctomycetota bacterium]
MTRTFILLVLFLSLGCAYRAAPPIDLNDRLARIEESRLQPTDMPMHASIDSMASDANSPASASNESPPLAKGRARSPKATRRGEAGSLSKNNGIAREQFSDSWNRALTLSDMDEPPPVSTSDAHESDALATEREDKYLRRPPLKSFWQTVKRDVKEMPCDLWRDTKRVYGNPLNLVILGTAYGGSLAIQESGPDSTVEHRINRHHDFQTPDHIFNNDDLRDAFGAIGNPATHFALAGAWYLLGQQTMDDKTYEVGKTLFSALTINGLTVMVGQTASWDRAPNGEWGTFPSGHTSSSFVFASVMHEAYGHLVGIPLYGLATLAGIERIDDGEHYLSDVVMGAVLGTVVGHSVAQGRDPEFFGWKVAPFASPHNGSGIAFIKTME